MVFMKNKMPTETVYKPLDTIKPSSYDLQSYPTATATIFERLMREGKQIIKGQVVLAATSYAILYTKPADKDFYLVHYSLTSSTTATIPPDPALATLSMGDNPAVLPSFYYEVFAAIHLHRNSDNQNCMACNFSIPVKVEKPYIYLTNYQTAANSYAFIIGFELPKGT